MVTLRYAGSMPREEEIQQFERPVVIDCVSEHHANVLSINGTRTTDGIKKVTLGCSAEIARSLATGQRFQFSGALSKRQA